jgi:YVTN family beta-propeller protein
MSSHHVLTATNESHLLIVAEELRSRIAFVNSVTKRVIATVAVGQNPYGVLNLPHAKKVFVSDWGSAAVTVVNTESHRTEATIAVGAHPTAVVLSPDRRHLYVSNSNADTISVIDTVRLQRVNTISVGLLAGHALGSAPEGLTIARDGSRLYVANAGDNAVAVVALADHGVTGTIVGRIPSGEYPTSVTIDKKGRKLFITNGYGDGPRADFPSGGRDPIYYNRIAGTMSVVAVPGDTQLRTYSSHVALNNHIAPRNDRSPFGATSPIKHVIYILKENQTYDSVLGDMSGGNGDPALTKYPERNTPNLHALASGFGLYDNFYLDGRSSADGHDWAMSANASDFNMKMWPQTYSQRGQPGHYEGESAIDLSPRGDICGTTHIAQGSRIVTTANSSPIHAPRIGCCRSRKPLRVADPSLLHCSSRSFLAAMCCACIPRFQTRLSPASPGIPTDPHYQGVSPQYSGVDRVREWAREFRKFMVAGNLPQLETI